MIDNFPFYKSTHMNTWKNSVRHTLCLHKGFQKIDREDIDINGTKYHNTSKQGHLWRMHPDRMQKEYLELLELILKGM